MRKNSSVDNLAKSAGLESLCRVVDLPIVSRAIAGVPREQR